MASEDIAASQSPASMTREQMARRHADMIAHGDAAASAIVADIAAKLNAARGSWAPLPTADDYHTAGQAALARGVTGGSTGDPIAALYRKWLGASFLNATGGGQ